MPSLNRIEIIGHLGKDPKTCVNANGKIYTHFTVATSEHKAGQTAETQWHNCVAWGEGLANALKEGQKGDLVRVEGKMVYGKYQEKATASVFAYSIMLLRRAYKQSDKMPIDKDSEVYAQQLADALGGEVVKEQKVVEEELTF